jgi:hypothetical protein
MVETMEEPLLGKVEKDEASPGGVVAFDGTSSLDRYGQNERKMLASSSSAAEKVSAVASKKAKALSMSFMKSLSGLCCDNCKSDPFETTDDVDVLGQTKRGVGDDHDNNDVRLGTHESGDLYNLQALRRSLSTISPLVSGPMLLDSLGSDALAGGGTTTSTVERIIGEYMCFCKFYQVHYNAGILTTLRFSLPCLRVSGSFHDADMLALVELLLRHANGALKHISRLDFAVASREGRHERNSKLLGFTSHGAMALAKALQTTEHVRQVLLPRHRIGPYGASAIFMACQMNPTIEVLNLRRCRIGKRGAYAFCELILGMAPNVAYYGRAPGGADTDDVKLRHNERTDHGLVHVDLSANMFGHVGTTAIECALVEFSLNGDGHRMVVNLEGNLVFPEVSGFAVPGSAGVGSCVVILFKFLIQSL